MLRGGSKSIWVHAGWRYPPRGSIGKAGPQLAAAARLVLPRAGESPGLLKVACGPRRMPPGSWEVDCTSQGCCPAVKTSACAGSRGPKACDASLPLHRLGLARLGFRRLVVALVGWRGSPASDSSIQAGSRVLTAAARVEPLVGEWGAVGPRHL